MKSSIQRRKVQSCNPYKIGMRGLILFLLSLVLVHGGYAGVVVESTSLLRPAMKGLDANKKVLVCPVVRSSDLCFQEIFGGDGDGGEGEHGGIASVYVRVKDTENLISMGGGDVGFVYLSGNEVLMNPLSALADISLLLESSNMAIKRTAKRVVALVDVAGIGFSTVEFVEKVQGLLLEVMNGLDMTQDSVSTEVRLFDSTSKTSTAEVREGVRASLGDWISGVREELLKPNQVLQFIKDTTRDTRTDLSEDEVDGTYVCANVADKFLSALAPKLNALSAASASGVSGVGAQEMIAIVDSALLSIEDEILDMNSRFGKTKTFKDAVLRCRMGLQSLIVDSYRNLLSSALSVAKSDFNNGMRRLGPGAGLVKVLSELSAKNVAEFEKTAKATQETVLETFNGWQKDSPLLGAKLLKGTNIASLLGYRTEAKNFAKYCAKRSKDHVDTLFLQGVYNPFVRTASYPPTHLNLNYLIDPRSIGFEIEHRSHYDTHDDCITPNRGDALYLPNTARIPFDPNTLPKGKTDSSWWQQLKDFYLEDD